MKEEVVIVGSGVGGATVAKELAGRSKNITILEKGQYANQLGTLKTMIGFYDERGKKKSKEGISIYRALMVGGTGIVSIANSVRASEPGLRVLGISLKEEFKETEKELRIMPVPDSHIGERTERITKAEEELGYDPRPMLKFVNFDRCKGCGLCIFGCPNGAKWTPLQYLEEAKNKGVELLTGMTVEEITHSGGKATGVKGVGPDGKFEISADIVILAAGGIGTPIILQKSGISNAGGNFFVDLYAITYGTIENVNMKPELPMAAVINELHESHGFILSPYMPPVPTIVFLPPLVEKMRMLRRDTSMGLMVKIKDDTTGRVNPDGSIEKKATRNDQKKLTEGISISEEILTKAGCDPESIFTTNPESAHPGGTAAIGKVVNIEQETEIKNLFVSDASILPESPGAPPILPIVALSKRLSKILANKLR